MEKIFIKACENENLKEAQKIYRGYLI